MALKALFLKLCLPLLECKPIEGHFNREKHFHNLLEENFRPKTLSDFCYRFK